MRQRYAIKKPTRWGNGLLLLLSSRDESTKQLFPQMASPCQEAGVKCKPLCPVWDAISLEW